MNALLSACAAYPGGEPGEALRQLTREFIGRARGDDAVLERAAEALKTLPPRGAAWLAVATGAAIERRAATPVAAHDGAERATTTPISARPVVDLLLSWLPLLPHADSESEQSPPPPTPEQKELLESLQLLGQSVVAHLARAPDLKAELSRNLPLLDRLATLETYTAAAAWIRETLLRSSGSLILLHAQSGRGFRLQYRNVATCFHLFSLIQAAIGEQLPGGRKPDARIAEAARGNSRETVQDEAWWHYGDPCSKVADLSSSIWGEGLVREIPVIDGERVIILWPQILASRTWDSAFFGPRLEALPPDVVVEAELSTADSAAWFGKLGIRRKRRKWWPW